jgi:hypothetical protein
MASGSDGISARTLAGIGVGGFMLVSEEQSFMFSCAS